MNTVCAFVFFAELLDETPVYKVLKFFIGTQAKHFFATADGVALFQIFKDSLEKIVESEYLLFSKDIAEFIGYVVWKAPGEPGSFSGCCHSAVIITHISDKSDSNLGLYIKNY